MVLNVFIGRKIAASDKIYSSLSSSMPSHIRTCFHVFSNSIDTWKPCNRRLPLRLKIRFERVETEFCKVRPFCHAPPPRSKSRECMPAIYSTFTKLFAERRKKKTLHPEISKRKLRRLLRIRWRGWNNLWAVIMCKSFVSTRQSSAEVGRKRFIITDWPDKNRK